MPIDPVSLLTLAARFAGPTMLLWGAKTWFEKTLEKGDRGGTVKRAQELLAAAGADLGKWGADGVFGPKTEDAVTWFQMSHLGPDGKPLKVSGEIDTETAWALEHRAPLWQTSGLSEKLKNEPLNLSSGDKRLPRAIPGSAGPARYGLLKEALSWYDRPTKEDPDGSNWGDGVSEILRNAGGPRPWCQHFVSHVFKCAMGLYPLGRDHGHVLTFWRDATSQGMAHEFADGYVPIPGDVFVMLYRRGGVLTGSGHAGFVLRSNGYQFNTVEGNASNRVKIGFREVNGGSMVGCVNLFDDATQPRVADIVQPGRQIIATR